MNNLVTKTVDLIYKMDHNDQLNQVIEAIKLKRNQLSRKAVAKFMIGDIYELPESIGLFDIVYCCNLQKFKCNDENNRPGGDV